VSAEGGSLIAVGDLGSNSFKFLIARPSSPGEPPAVVRDWLVVTRLSQGMSLEEGFSPDAMERSVLALEGFFREVEEWSVPREQTFLIATEAVRSNPKGLSGLRHLIRERFGVGIRVLSEREEAELAFGAARLAFPKLACAFDLGGGSLDAAWREGEGLRTLSVKVGVRVVADRGGARPPMELERAKRIRDELARLLAERLAPLGMVPLPCALLGGTATTLVQLKERKLIGQLGYPLRVVLSQSDVWRQVEFLSGHTEEEIAATGFVHPKRTDVILAGALIVAALLEALDLMSLLVTDLGIRHMVAARGGI